MRLTVALTFVLLTLFVVSRGSEAQPPSAESEYPPLPGPSPNAQVVKVSEEIATEEDPVFYVRDESDPERVIAYGWDGRRRGELVISSSEPYGLYPSLDGTMVLLAYADAHVVSGGESLGKADAGMWAGDNEHLCVFLNELGGRGGPRERRISENSFEGQSPAGYLFVETITGERRRVVNLGSFGPHGGPAILACNAEADRAVIAESFVGHLSNVMMVRLSDATVLYQDPNTEPGALGIVASRDGSLLAEGAPAGHILGGSFIVRRIPSGEEVAKVTGGGIVAFSDDNMRVLTVQYLNNSNEFGRYRVVELATSRVIWSAVLSPGRVLTRPHSADFIVTGSIWEPSKTRENGRDRFEDLWLIPGDGAARLLLTHASLAG